MNTTSKPNDADARTFAGIDDKVEIVSDDPAIRKMMLDIYAGDYSHESVPATRAIGSTEPPTVSFPWNDEESGLKVRTEKKREVFERQILAEAKDVFDRADRRDRKSQK